MTTSINVERRRFRARRALYSFSTALCSGLAFVSVPAVAQQAGLTSGDALVTPSYNPVDENGVDILSGRFSIHSPMLSMGGADALSKFYFTWTGQLWMPNTPRLWLDQNYHIIIEHDGVSEEFADAKATGNSYGNGVGTEYRYTQKRPNIGSSLSCTFIGAVSGGQTWITQCFYGSRLGQAIRFFGNTPANGSYPTAAANDYEQFGNARVWPSVFTDFGRGNTTYLVDGPATRSGSDGGGLPVDYPNGIKVAKQQAYFSPTIAFTMTNKAVAGATQVMTISTPSLDGSDRSKSYLRPKGTTQTFTDPLGRVSSYTFNATGDLVQVLSAGGVTATIAYDGSHRVTSYSKNGSTWTYRYDFSATSTGSGTSTVTAPDNTVKTITHNATPGPVTSSTDELGHTSHYQYDSYDRIIEVDRPNDDGTSYAASTYLYDGRGNLTQVTTNPKPNLGGNPQVSKLVYPSACGTGFLCNQPSQLIDARGNTTDIAYDPNNYLPSSITRPAGSDGVRPQIRNTYTSMGYWSKDSNGNPVQATDRTVPKLTETATCMTQASCVGTSDETKTVYSFAFRDGTAANNLEPVTVTKQLGSGTILAAVGATYDAIGNTTYIDGPISGSADTSRMIWDADREKVGEIGPALGNGLPSLANRTTYNGDGQVVLVEQGNVTDQSDSSWSRFSTNQRTATAYDGAGRAVTTAAAGTGVTLTVTQMSYNSAGRPTCVAVRMNDAAFPTIAANGSLSSGQLKPDACSADTSGAYGSDRVTKTDYDAVGHPTTITQGIGTTSPTVQARYTWNVAGKRTSVTDGNGNLATMGYDGFDRPILWTFPSLTSTGQVNAADYEAYRYDDNGNRLWTRKRDAREFTYDYDALNRIIDKIVPKSCITGYVCTAVPAAATRNVYYGYDLRSLMTYARFDSSTGEGVTMTYDGRGLPTATTTAFLGSTRTLQSAYDGAGNRTKLTFPDNQYFYTTYDSISRSNSVVQTDGTTVDVASYEARGYQISRFNGLATYASDALGRNVNVGIDLAGIQSDVTYGSSYNPAGQIVTGTRSNDHYAYSGLINTNQGYTVNGLNEYTGVGTSTVSYDANGNLVANGSLGYTYDAENRVVQTALGAQLVYDPLGHLFQISSGSGTTQFLYDNDRIAAEYDGNNNLLRRYVHGPNGDDPMFWYEGSGLGSRRLMFADRQGSIVAVSDASGNVVGTNSYDEYGKPGNGNIGRFQYTGQAWFPELGAYYYKARFYSPSLGRFFQTDPIGYADQINLYGYLRNDPLNGRDTTGTQDDQLPELTETFQGSPGTPSDDSSSHPFSFSFSNLFSGLQFPTLSAQLQTTPSPQKAPASNDPCSGPVRAFGVNVNGILGLGLTFSFGSYHTAGGASGFYFSGGGGAGADVGVTGVYTHSNGISSFSGYSESAGGAVTIPFLDKAVGGAANYNIGPDGKNVQTGYSVFGSGVPGLPGVKVGASATATETHLLSGACAGR